MKTKLIALSTLLLTTIFLSFTNVNEIGQCYIAFNSATNLKAADPDRLPKTAEKFGIVDTEEGEIKISCIDGYRILYNNDMKAPFVNLKVELSEINSYEKDKKNLLANLRYLNSHSTGMETKDIIELEFNGFKIYGLSRASIES